MDPDGGLGCIMARFGTGRVSASIRKRFYDNFTRDNSTGTTGVSTDGSILTVLRGVFNISSNALTTSTAVSEYPILYTDMLVENVDMRLVSANQGGMAAIWITDSGNWWGVQKSSAAESCNCSTYYYSCNCSSYSYQCNCGQTCNTCYYSGSYTCGSYSGSYCIYYIWTPGTAYSCCTYSCQTCYGYSCQTCSGYSCQTCYPQYIKILKSVSNTVSVIFSTTVAAVAQALRIKTSGDQITIQAFSDSSMTSQIGGDITHTPTSPAKTTKFGISISPSSYNQGNSISSIQIDRN